MSEELSALDATFLELEESDQSAHMHIGGVILIEPQPGGGAPPLEAIREDVLARLPDLPRYRQRLSAPHTGGLRWPDWKEDTDFHIDRHVFAAGLPAPGGTAELLDWAGDFYSSRLDRAKPLWELAVLELSDGRWALVTKTHHCMIDGVGSVDIAQLLLDTQPERRINSTYGPGAEHRAAVEATEPAAPAWRRAAARIARPGLTVGHAAVRTAQAGLHATESAVGVAAHPKRAREAWHRSKALAELIVRDEMIAAPPSSLNRPIGAKRRLSVLGVDLDDLRAIKRSLGGTVNDVVLAAAAGGLRRLLEHRGEEPPSGGLRAMVPVNIRSAGDRLAMGNRISSLFVHLPVAEEDPRRRYQLQIEEAEGLKSGAQAIGTSTLVDLISHAPPVIHSFLARSMYATRLFNITITNVPGPPSPFFYFGSEVEEVWPLVPIAAEHALGLAVFSYNGKVFFCWNADRDTVRDLDVLASGVSESLEELRELALVA